MTTRPSRKAPSSLLSATMASSARTRSSSCLKGRTKGAEDSNSKTGSKVAPPAAIDPVSKSPPGIDQDSAPPTSNAPKLPSPSTDSVGSFTGPRAAVEPTGNATRVDADDDDLSLFTAGFEDLAKSNGTTGGSSTTNPAKVGYGAEFSGTKGTRPSKYPPSGGVTGTVDDASKAIEVIDGADEATPTSGKSNTTNMTDISPGNAASDTFPSASNNIVNDDASPPAPATASVNLNDALTVASKLTATESAGTNGTLPSPSGGVTGVIDDASKAMEVVAVVGAVAGMVAGAVAGTVAATNAPAFPTPASATTAVAGSPKTTVESTLEGNIASTDTSPSPKNLYSIFASKTPSKPPTLTPLGKTSPAIKAPATATTTLARPTIDALNSAASVRPSVIDVTPSVSSVVAAVGAESITHGAETPGKFTFSTTCAAPTQPSPDGRSYWDSKCD